MRKLILAALIVLCLAGCAKAPEATEPVTSAPTMDTTVPDTEATEPTVTEPTVTEPPVTEPPITEPSATEPPATEPPILTGWQELEGKRYFYNEDGEPHVGWLEVEGHQYYFRKDGAMAKGKVVIDGQARYFTSSGKEILLVNPWNYIPEDYAVELKKIQGYRVATEAFDALTEMLRDCEKAGHAALLASGYRTHGDQIYLYQRRIDRFIAQGYDEETAKTEAAKRVAVPGTSEHELGLAVDIVDADYQTMNKEQEKTATQKWLLEHCWEYGFILRYPNDKTDVTGIIYEPWHYRYVGIELAMELRDSGLCLEEYLESLTE